MASVFLRVIATQNIKRELHFKVLFDSNPMKLINYHLVNLGLESYTKWSMHINNIFKWEESNFERNSNLLI